MPELPDIVVYCESLASRIRGARLERVRVKSLNLLRTVEPPLEATYGLRIVSVWRLGKRIVIELEDGPCLVVHLMIAGRFHWSAAGAAVPGKVGLAAFDFSTGTLLLTEASTKQRASLHVMASAAAARTLSAGGIEPLECTAKEFRAALTRENHTVKRALTDPRLLSGIGNAYSDEILHRARLSPMVLTSRMSDEEHARLFAGTRDILTNGRSGCAPRRGTNSPRR
jgi:formamidopyrimidine-DNA glycosylase